MDSDNQIFRVYCSICSKEQKSKMTWGEYIKYKLLDGKSKGYHEIDSTLLSNNTNKIPTACPFGHKINTNRTKTINK